MPQNEGLGFADRITPVFRNPGGSNVPAQVDAQGRLYASLAPFGDPTNSWSVVDAPAAGAIASASKIAPANTYLVCTSFTAAMSQITAAGSLWRVTLTDSVDGVKWAAYMQCAVNVSYAVGIQNGGPIYSSLAGTLTLTFTAVTGPTAQWTQTAMMTGFYVGT